MLLQFAILVLLWDFYRFVLVQEIVFFQVIDFALGGTRGIFSAGSHKIYAVLYLFLVYFLIELYHTHPKILVADIFTV